MKRIDIPGREPLELSHLVLDYNGTLALDGLPLEGVRERIDTLSRDLTVHIITADTYGSVRKALSGWPVSISIIDKEGQDRAKESFILSLEGSAAALGNGYNDRLMLQEARPGIAVVGGEGAGTAAIFTADVLANSIQDALDLLIHIDRLRATLRN
jgi:soluble P-type ATPase